MHRLGDILIIEHKTIDRIGQSRFVKQLLPENLSILKHIVNGNEFDDELNEQLIVVDDFGEGCLGWVDHLVILEFDVGAEELDAEEEDVVFGSIVFGYDGY